MDIFDNSLTDSLNNFVTEMIQGTLASKSVLISEISIGIHPENKNIKHVEKRLLRHIKTFNNQNELQEKHQTFIDKKFDNNTIKSTGSSIYIKPFIQKTSQAYING